MVTTRGRSGTGEPKKRAGLRTKVTALTKLAQSTNTVVQKRGGSHSKVTVPAKITQQPKMVVQKRRQALSQAPQLGTHVLCLFVGPQRELVTLHTELLPEATRTYIAEKNEGQQVWQLPDEDVDIFKIYRSYLYTNRIHSVSEADRDTPDDGSSWIHDDGEWTKLAHCYLFGVTVKDEGFANASITAVVEKMTELDRYPTGIASDVYQYTQPGDKLRQLLVDLHVWRGQGTWIKPPHGDADAPKEFLQDVIGGLARVGSDIYEADAEMPWEANGCAYHTHAGGERCMA